MAGSTKYKQEGFYIHLIQSWKQIEFVYLVCLDIKNSVNEDISLLINIFCCFIKIHTYLILHLLTVNYDVSSYWT